jgi:hypothetical protein
MHTVINQTRRVFMYVHSGEVHGRLNKMRKYEYGDWYIVIPQFIVNIVRLSTGAGSEGMKLEAQA